MVPRQIIEQIMALASASPQAEICGLIDNTGTIHPIRNVAGRTHSFIFEKRGYFAALKKIADGGRSVTCVYHSHTTGSPDPSQADFGAIKRLKVNYLIVTTTSYRWVPYEP